MFVPDLNQSTDWSFPIPLLYGPGRLAELGALCRSHGVTNALIVTDRASRDLPFVQGALDALAHTLSLAISLCLHPSQLPSSPLPFVPCAKPPVNLRFVVRPSPPAVVDREPSPQALESFYELAVPVSGVA